MLTLNVITTVDEEKFINGSVNGTKFNVSYSDDLFKSLQDLKTQINNATSSEDYYKAIESAKSLINATLDGEGDLITQANKDLILDSKTGKYYVSIEDEVSITPVPQRLVNVILESVEKGIDSTPIVKAWIRFLRNPNFTEQKAELFAEYVTAVIIDRDMVQKLVDEEGFSETQAIKRSLYNDVSITEEGLIVAKKYARLLNEGYEMDKETNKVKKVPMYGKTEDKVDRVTGEVTKGEFLKPEFAEEMYFEPPVQGTRGDAFSSGETKGHIIRVGEIHALDDWNQVNTNDNQSCVKGLHVGRICRLVA